MTKERFLNYTDAIVAIIATIMVLELPVPKEATFSALKEAATPFFAYLLSFLVIWTVWYNHHGLFKQVKKINARIYWYNGIWVFSMSLFPFTTAWVGRHPLAFLPEFLYLVILILWSLPFSLMERELVKENEYQRERSVYGGRRQTIYYGILCSGLLIVWFFPVYVLLSLIPFVLNSIIVQIKYGGVY